MPEIRSIDFDYWCNSKKDIILVLMERGKVESVSELARIIDKGFSVTYRHVLDLQMRGMVAFRKTDDTNKREIRLRKEDLTLEEAFCTL